MAYTEAELTEMGLENPNAPTEEEALKEENIRRQIERMKLVLDVIEARKALSDFDLDDIASSRHTLSTTKEL